MDTDEEDLSGVLEELEEPYDENTTWNEWVLYAGLTLKGGDQFLPLGETSEYVRATNLKLAHWCSDCSDFRRQISLRTVVHIDDLLPDVCANCFFSFSLCASGRLRLCCSRCKAPTERSWSRITELNRLCLLEAIKVAILSQLIYKYFSPNGDPKWVMKTYNPWKF